MFARIRAAGTWIGVIASSELDTLDLNLSRAIDGYAGGSYAPSSPIVIGGAGMIFSGSTNIGANLTVGGTAYVTGDTTLHQTLAVHGITTLSAKLYGTDVDFSGAYAFNGSGTLGNSSTDTLSVVATASFGQSVTLSKGASLTSGSVLEVGNNTSGYVPRTLWGWDGDDYHNERFHRVYYPLDLPRTRHRTLVLAVDGLVDGETVVVTNAHEKYTIGLTIGVANPVFYNIGGKSDTDFSYPQTVTFAWCASRNKWRVVAYQADRTV